MNSISKPSLKFAGGWPLVIAVSLAASAALFAWGVPYGNDLPHHFRVATGFVDAMQMGDFYPSWLDHTNGGYGDPSVRFYPPALYYLLAGFRLLGADWYLATVLTFALATVAGGLGVYLWTTNFVEQRYAIAAAVLCALAPFHANELYQAGMYGQYLCAGLVPFVFAFVERLIRDGGWRDAGWLGFAVAAVILSNVPFAFVGLASVGIYASVRLYQSFSRSAVVQLAIGAISGLSISSIYWLPMLFELKWKAASGAGQGAWFDYRNNFILNITLDETGDYWASVLAVVTALLVLPSIILLVRRNKEAAAPAIVALAAFLMATPLSKPVWDAFPLLQETQFPWRWLTVASACAGLLAAMSIREYAKMWRVRRPLALAAFGVMLIVPAFSIFQVIRNARYVGQAAFNQSVEQLRGTGTNADFLPVWANGKPKEAGPPIAAANRGIEIVEWSAERKEFKIAAGPPTDVRAALNYYPHWNATTDGIRISTKPDADGALLFHMPDGEAIVKLEFVEPNATLAASMFCFAGIMFAFLLVLKNRRPAGDRDDITYG